MTEPVLLPYSLVVGQREIKKALELNFVAPGIGGVLISGQRGTAKSTTVRGFAVMMYGELPVTLPINATDDRVLGGWRLDELMRGEPHRQPGLLEEAGERGLLYIDEVNLLDDHVVNIILDVASTGVLTVQREGIDERKELRFGLVGTMNPEEGWLRPQLLDRFGLMVKVRAEEDPELRREILTTALAMDQARHGVDPGLLADGRAGDAELRAELEAARARLYDVAVSKDIARLCADVAAAFQAAGHRGDVVLALAARALAAREGAVGVGPAHVADAAPMALRHRRGDSAQEGGTGWGQEEESRLAQLVVEWRRSL